MSTSQTIQPRLVEPEERGAAPELWFSQPGDGTIYIALKDGGPVLVHVWPYDVIENKGSTAAMRAHANALTAACDYFDRMKRSGKTLAWVKPVKPAKSKK